MNVVLLVLIRNESDNTCKYMKYINLDINWSKRRY